MVKLIVILALLFLFFYLLARRQNRRFRSHRRTILDRYRQRLEDMESERPEEQEDSQEE